MRKLFLLFAFSCCELPSSITFAQTVFWTEIGKGNIDTAAFSGADEHAIITGLKTPYGIAFDTDSDRVYWTDVIGGQIWRSNHDGSNPRLILDSLELPRGLAIDETGKKIYWVENGGKKIRSADLDGTSLADLLTTKLSAPTQIAFDPTHGKLYWTDNGDSVKYIGTCTTSGANPTLIDSTKAFVSGIFVDAVHSRIYWTEYGPARRIRSANLDGSGVTTIDSFTTSDPRGIFVAPSEGKIFWTDYLTNRIETASLTGSGETVLDSSLSNPLSIYGSNGIDHGTGVAEKGNTPASYQLNQNYPNPFNPSTAISYQLQVNGQVTLRVYDVLGREVATLVNQKEDAGTHAVKFDGDNLPSGIYFYRLSTPGYVRTMKMVLLK